MAFLNFTVVSDHVSTILYNFLRAFIRNKNWIWVLVCQKTSSSTFSQRRSFQTKALNLAHKSFQIFSTSSIACTFILKFVEFRQLFNVWIMNFLQSLKFFKTSFRNYQIFCSFIRSYYKLVTRYLLNNE